MSSSTPTTVRDTIIALRPSEPVYWFDQDLTIDELRRTVAVINTAMREKRN